MSEIPSPTLEIKRVTAERVMDEMREIVRAACRDGPMRERSFEIAAKRLDLSHSRVKAIFYGEAATLSAHEWVNAKEWQTRFAEQREQLDLLDAELTAKLDESCAGFMRAWDRVRPPRRRPMAQGENQTERQVVRLKRG